MVDVNWATKVVTILKSDMTLLSGTLYELDLATLQLILKAHEASEEGIVFEDIHLHNPPVGVGSITLARVLQFINNYTVTFEDGQYAVDLEGANSNIGDVVNRNQVSFFSKNSAGLIDAAVLGAQVLDVYRILGLDSDHPLIVTATERKSGSVITQTIGVVGGTVTVTRS